MMDRMDLFLIGVKPSILVFYMSLDDWFSKENIEEFSKTDDYLFLNGRYPKIHFKHRNCVLFFRDTHLADLFISNGLIDCCDLDLKARVVDYDHSILGEFLGFPPLAIIDWSTVFTFKNVPRASILYYGMRFVCLPENAKSCLDWLRYNRPVPDYLIDTNYEKICML